MKKYIVFTLTGVVVLVIAVISVLTASAAPLNGWNTPVPGKMNGKSQGWRGSGNGEGQGGQGGNIQTPLTKAEINGLNDAILEEYGALNLYQEIIQQFGSVYPFDVIARSEQQHANALIRQAQKYGVEVPSNPGLGEKTTYATLADACTAGVAAEQADADLYTQIKTVTTHSDILRVYTNLQNASLNNHLPAFQTCD